MMDLTHTFAHKLEEVRWGKAVGAAFIAGLVFLALEIVLVAIFEDASPWKLPHMAAAIALGPGVLPVVDGFDLAVLVTALFVHFVLATLFAWILVPIIEEMAVSRATVLGIGFGLILYIINFYVLTAAFPWFAEARSWITICTHLAFGGVLAWSYLWLRHRATA